MSRSLGVTVDEKAIISVTPLSDIPKIVGDCRSAFNKGTTLPVEFRKRQLLQLRKMIKENQKEWIKRIQDHMHRPYHEVKNTEISYVLSEISYLYNNLDKLVEPKKVSSPAAFVADTGELHSTPRGCALIMSTWNFPVQVLFAPLAGAIAAGCTAVLRPSEIANNVALLVKELVPQYLDEQCYRVVTGGVAQNEELLKQKFDIIFYTGSCYVGKIVAQAAAKHLTHVILELGGKNPVIIDETTNLRVAARRIVWGRFGVNCGQVCIAPEYVMIPRKLQENFIGEAIKAIEEFFGKDISMSKDYGRIVSQNHFDRLEAIIKDNKKKIAYSGESNKLQRYIAPTILKDITADDPVMQEEVFGPILSIMPVDDIKKECIPFIKGREKPLSLYVFSRDKLFIKQLVTHTDSGGVTINDVMMHFAFNGFPFGGTGASGTGSYHGHYSFAAFSHEKPVLQKHHALEIVNRIRYPPYTERKAKIIRSMTEEKISRWSPYTHTFLFTGGIAATVYLLHSRL